MYELRLQRRIKDTDKNTCLATELYNWNGLSDCYSNNWIYKVNTFQWTLAPYSINDSHVFRVNSTAEVSCYAVFSPNSFSPTTYLSSSVKITGGDGSSSNPFTLSVE